MNERVTLRSRIIKVNYQGRRKRIALKVRHKFLTVSRFIGLKVTYKFLTKRKLDGSIKNFSLDYWYIYNLL